MFNDDTTQHAEEGTPHIKLNTLHLPAQEEGTYTPQEVIRKDFDLLWEAITAEIYQDWPLTAVADEVINARLRLYERAGLLRAAE